MRNKLKIGIIGCGNIVQMVHLPVLFNISEVQIEFLYDVDYKRSKKLGESFGLFFAKDESIIDEHEVDCYLIATPYGTRGPLYEKLAKKGKFIFIEKPVILSNDDIKTFKELKIFDKSFSGFMRRYYSNTNILKNILASISKKPKRVIISEGSKATAISKDFTYQSSGVLSGGGILAETACHLLDQIDYIFPKAQYKVNKSSLILDGDIEVHVEGSVDIVLDNAKIPLELKFSRLDQLANEICIEFEDLSFCTGINPGDKVNACFVNEKYQLEHDFSYAVNSYQAFYLEWLSCIESIRGIKSSTNALSNTLNSGILIENLRNWAHENNTTQNI